MPHLGKLAPHLQLCACFTAVALCLWASIEALINENNIAIKICIFTYDFYLCWVKKTGY